MTKSMTGRSRIAPPTIKTPDLITFDSPIVERIWLVTDKGHGFWWASPRPLAESARLMADDARRRGLQLLSE